METINFDKEGRESNVGPYKEALHSESINASNTVETFNGEVKESLQASLDDVAYLDPIMTFTTVIKPQGVMEPQRRSSTFSPRFCKELFLRCWPPSKII